MSARGANVIDLNDYRALRLAARQGMASSAPSLPVMWFAPIMFVGFFAFVPWRQTLHVAATDAS